MYGRYIPAWNIYDCITNALFDIAAEHADTPFAQPWNCAERKVTYNVTPVGGTDIVWADFASIVAVHCDTIGDFKVPNSDYEVIKNGQLKARGSIRYGNTDEEVE